MSEFHDDLKEYGMYDWYNDNDQWLMYLENAASCIHNWSVHLRKRVLPGMATPDGFLSLAQVQKLLEETFEGEINLDEPEGYSW